MSLMGPQEYRLLLWPLWNEHRDELTTNKELMKLKPDFDVYDALFYNNELFCIGLWRNDELIGYSVNFLKTNIHYSDVLMFQNDLIFVAKAHRQSRAGLLLLKETENWAREAGADMIVWHAKPDTSLDKILKKKKFKVQDILYTQEL